MRVKVGKLGNQILVVEDLRKFYESIPKQDHSNLFPAREDTSTREDRQKEQFEQDPSICGKGQEKLTLLK
ncbi:MAG TPA: hypothetical protein ENG13_03195, partial [bacterium]|nr:hypothetical protein [bacterium]HEX68053.1 hypothetical protein [bacterium]